MKNIKKTIIIAVILTGLSGCGILKSSTDTGTVGVERMQLLTVSASEMNAGSVKAYADVIAQAKKEGNLNPDAKQLKRIRNIANRLTPQTGIFRKDAPKWDWQVNVIKSDQLNAWCMPGGKIAFYTGIIDKLELTDGEIAAIMGHEIAHALREHGRERASQQQIQSTGLALLGQFAGLGKQTLDLSAMALNVTIGLPHGRTQETESDRIGVELAARAGYNPKDAIKVWQKMSKYSKGAPPEILSTHPSNATRIKDLTKYAAKVKHLYTPR